jgi:hypothetical protein
VPLDRVEDLCERCVVAAKHLRRHPWVMLGCVVFSIAAWFAVGFGIRVLAE